MRGVLPKPHAVHCFVWILSDTLPQRLHVTCVRFCLFPIEGVPFDIYLHLVELFRLSINYRDKYYL